MSITSEGIKIKSYDEVVASLETKFKQRFGESFDTTKESPDGVNIRIMAEYIDTMQQLAEKAYHAYNPRVVEGIGLDNLVSLNGIRRIENEPTKVGLLFNTIDHVGETLFAGQKVKSNVDGVEFVTLSDVVLPGEVLAECTKLGAIRVQPNEVTEVVDSPFPDLTVANPEAGITGIVREEDPQLRARRERSVIRAGTATAEAIYAALADLNLEFIAIIENNTSVEVDGIPPKAFHTIAEGSTLQLIARRIFENCPIGIQAYGNQTQIVTDSEGYQHSIGISRPVRVDIHVKVELYRPENVAINRLRDIKTYVAAHLNKIQISHPVEWARLFAPVTIAAPDVNIKNVWVSKDGVNWVMQDIAMGATERPFALEENVIIEEL